MPLAGVVVSRNGLLPPPPTGSNGSLAAETGPESCKSTNGTSPTLKCAALATGMKCLPSSKLPLAQGNVLHDWHAEVLAIRAFKRWLVDECADLARKGVQSEHEWLRWRRMGRQPPDEDGDEDEGEEAAESSRPEQRDLDHEATTEKSEENEGSQDHPFELRHDVSIHMYCSEAPCGDASMELTMSAQEDSTPWTTPPGADSMPGRGNFDRLGVVRRKPARPDAPTTWSKSCSDKLAMKQCTGLLSSVTSLLVHPEGVYLTSLVLPTSQIVPEAIHRAFSPQGRMKNLADKRWQGGYAFKPFDVKATSRVFEYSKDAAAAEGAEAVPSNLSTLYTASGRQEVLINGVLQGRKQFDPKGASCASRRGMWEGVREVAGMVGMSGMSGSSVGGEVRSYAEVKGDARLRDRDRVKREVREEALEGWKRNLGDEEWTL